MSLVSQIYPNSFLRSADVKALPGGTVVGTIKTVSSEAVGDPPQTKLAVHFVEAILALLLNASNAKIVARKLGDNTDLWPGARIKIGTQRVSFRGEIVDGLVVLGVAKPRVTQLVPLAQPSPPPPPAVPAEELADDNEDEIPF